MTAIDSQTDARNRGSGDGPWSFAYFRQIYSHRVDLAPHGVELTQVAPHELIAMSSHLDGPYEVISGAIAPSMTEGPAVMEVAPQRWHLLYDHCMDNCYGTSVSTDLVHWQVADGTAFPPEARHGGVVRVTEAELTRLLTRFGREGRES